MIPQFPREKKKKREKTNKFGRRVSLNGKMWYNKNDSILQNKKGWRRFFEGNSPAPDFDKHVRRMVYGKAVFGRAFQIDRRPEAGNGLYAP